MLSAIRRARQLIFLLVSLTPPLGSIHRHCGARVPAALHRLQLPQGLCLVDRMPRRPLLLSLLRFLQAQLQERQISRKHSFVLLYGVGALIRRISISGSIGRRRLTRFHFAWENV